MITIHIVQGDRSGWFFTDSEELPGLILGASTLARLERQIPEAVEMLAPGTRFRVRRDAVRRAAIKAVA